MPTAFIMVFCTSQTRALTKAYFCERKQKSRTFVRDFYLGASDRNRTGDLILTKDALYQLSHRSIHSVTYYIKVCRNCQEGFFNLFRKEKNISKKIFILRTQTQKNTTELFVCAVLFCGVRHFGANFVFLL